MSSRRGPSPGTYRPDWAWKPNSATQRALARGTSKLNRNAKTAADYLRSLKPSEREQLLTQLNEVFKS